MEPLTDDLTNSWRINDLDGGLAADLSNLQGLGQDLVKDLDAYNMTEVLNLPIFKEEDDPLDSASLEQLKSLEQSGFLLNGSFSYSHPKENLTHSCLSAAQRRFAILLKVPTAPGRKLTEETLTYLNQSQSYEMILQCMDAKQDDGQLLKGNARLGFHERRFQVVENEKYEEWIANRPNERLLEIDVPMSVGIQNIKDKGCHSNALEFEWDPKKETRLYIRINCVSSDFTKGKSGESGIPLRLQIDIFDAGRTYPEYSCGCQVKVFKPKGADRKLKAEKTKHDNLPREEAELLQQSRDVTVLKQLEPLESYVCESSTPVSISENSWLSNCSSQLDQSMSNVSLVCSSIPQASPPKEPQPSQAAIAKVQTLTPDSTVEETSTWLQINRFHTYQRTFANFTGADLLRASRDDLIQLCGPADGIRLKNALQARASRPLLTMYVSPEWQCINSGMREYHAMFLEHLTAEELRKKLALKCLLEADHISAVYKQGPTGILILVDDEVVRNFMDETHHVMQIMQGCNGFYDSFYSPTFAVVGYEGEITIHTKVTMKILLIN